MSAPRTLDSFDVETREVAEHVLQYGTSITLTFPTKSTATQARQRFNYLPQVMAKTPNPLQEIARQLRCSLVQERPDGTWQLTVSHVSATPVAIAIRESFAKWKAENGVTLDNPMGNQGKPV